MSDDEFEEVSVEVQERCFIRTKYTHVGCMRDSNMPLHIARRFLADPTYYQTVYCSRCKEELPSNEFIWADNDEPIDRPVIIGYSTDE